MNTAAILNIESYHVNVLCPECGDRMWRTPLYATFCNAHGCKIKGVFFEPPMLSINKDWYEFQRDKATRQNKSEREGNMTKRKRPEPTSTRNMDPGGALSWTDRLLILGLVIFLVIASIYVFGSAFVACEHGCRYGVIMSDEQSDNGKMSAGGLTRGNR